VRELVGIDDQRIDRIRSPAIERPEADKAAVRVGEHRAGPAVDLGAPELDASRATAGATQPASVLATRRLPCRLRASAGTRPRRA
jgi:hypothetical protein